MRQWLCLPSACRAHILGLLLVKELVLVDLYANIAVSTQKVRALPHLRADTAMYDLLKLFQSGRTHMVSGHEVLISHGQTYEASGSAPSCQVMLDLSHCGRTLHASVHGTLKLGVGGVLAAVLLRPKGSAGPCLKGSLGLSAAVRRL